MGYSPWDHKELDLTVWLSVRTHTHTHTHVSESELYLDYQLSFKKVLKKGAKHTYREGEDQGVKNKILNTSERNIKICIFMIWAQRVFKINLINIYHNNL